MMPSATQLVICLVIAVLIFGTKRIRQLGGDLGGMIKGVRDGLKEAEPTIDELKDLQGDIQQLKTRVQETSSVRTSESDW